VHSIVATYSGDIANNGSSSAPLSQTIAPASGATTVWVDDALPAGAGTNGSEPFRWITGNPAPFSGTRAHQSVIASGVHQHYFTGATSRLSVGIGDKLFAYVYLDPANPPREVMLQWYDGSSWDHRAYWGANLIAWGASNRGALPPLGQWVRLEVPASAVNLEGRTVSGMAFTVYDGRATWDYAGKASSSSSGNQPPIARFTANPSSAAVGTPIAFSAAASSDPDGSISSYAWNFGNGTTGSGVSISKAFAAPGTYTVTLTVTDNRAATGTTSFSVNITAAGRTTVWVDDALPAGAGTNGSEPFTWITGNPAPFSGTRAHQSVIASGVHQHYFTGATTRLSVGIGDKLFAYVYLDPAHPPREVMLQWYDGSSWDHRAYWGANLIAWGASNRGALPALGQWVRLEVPATAVNLQGRTVSGMAFTVYDGRATWDYAGKLMP
jgi:hypothetical protein